MLIRLAPSRPREVLGRCLAPLGQALKVDRDHDEIERCYRAARAAAGAAIAKAGAAVERSLIVIFMPGCADTGAGSRTAQRARRG